MNSFKWCFGYYAHPLSSVPKSKEERILHRKSAPCVHLKAFRELLLMQQNKSHIVAFKIYFQENA